MPWRLVIVLIFLSTARLWAAERYIYKSSDPRLVRCADILKGLASLTSSEEQKSALREVIATSFEGRLIMEMREWSDHFIKGDLGEKIPGKLLYGGDGRPYEPGFGRPKMIHRFKKHMWSSLRMIPNIGPLFKETLRMFSLENPKISQFQTNGDSPITLEWSPGPAIELTELIDIGSRNDKLALNSTSPYFAVIGTYGENPQTERSDSEDGQSVIRLFKWNANGGIDELRPITIPGTVGYYAGPFAMGDSHYIVVHGYRFSKTNRKMSKTLRSIRITDQGGEVVSTSKFGGNPGLPHRTPSGVVFLSQVSYGNGYEASRLRADGVLENVKSFLSDEGVLEAFTMGREVILAYHNVRVALEGHKGYLKLREVELDGDEPKIVSERNFKAPNPEINHPVRTSEHGVFALNDRTKRWRGVSYLRKNEDGSWRIDSDVNRQLKKAQVRSVSVADRSSGTTYYLTSSGSEKDSDAQLRLLRIDRSSSELGSLTLNIPAGYGFSNGNHAIRFGGASYYALSNQYNDVLVVRATEKGIEALEARSSPNMYFMRFRGFVIQGDVLYMAVSLNRLIHHLDSSGIVEELQFIKVASSAHREKK